jgi:uncharacterized integral membrane protein
MSKVDRRPLPPPPVRWLRTFWAYRHLTAAAIVLGVTLWFITANQQPATVRFPFGLGQMNTSVGLAFLSGVLTGCVVTLLFVTIVWTLRRGKTEASQIGLPGSAEAKFGPLPETSWTDELPPSDYAARSGEGISGAGLQAR